MFKKILCVGMGIYMNMLGAMTLDEYSGDCPPNYRELMPTEFIECAKLAAEQKFDEGLECIKNVGSEKYYSNKKIHEDLKKTYNFAVEEFNSPDRNFNGIKYALDSSITLKDFLYENVLLYFWWNHYYPIYEGLITI
jgi:hypothetical protein